MIDQIGYAAATLTTISFLPQAVRTIRTRDTKSISMIMYLLFASGVLLWLVYGLLLCNYVFILTNTITLILASIILSVKITNKMKAQKVKKRKPRKRREVKKNR